MNKNKFIKILLFFLSIPCLANSNILAMKQSQLHSQLDQISYDLKVAIISILIFLLNTKGGYINRYLKDNVIEYVFRYGWLSRYDLNKDPYAKLNHYVEFNSFLDKDTTVMTLGISFYPKSGRVLVKKIVRSLTQIQEKNKNFEFLYGAYYNDYYKVPKKTCFFNCYLGSKSEENINLTRLFENLRKTIYNYNNNNNNINANNFVFRNDNIIDNQFNNNSGTTNNNLGSESYKDRNDNSNSANNIYRSDLIDNEKGLSEIIEEISDNTTEQNNEEINDGVSNSDLNNELSRNDSNNLSNTF